MNMFFRWVLVVFGCGICAVRTLRADEELRRTQQSLRDQGFYFGTVDGTPGDQTNQAVRRYQIRNGLSVSGQLDDETRRSIEKNGEAVPPISGRNSSGSQAVEEPSATPGRASPDPAYQRPTVRPVPTEDPSAEPAPRPSVPRPESRVDPGVPPPPPDVEAGLPRNAVLPSARLSALFEGTPYEFAPPPVQSDTVRKAQFVLTKQGFYDGAVNGVPGAVFGDALTNYQGHNRLRKTGRLDVSTLGTMRLLPGRQSVAPHDRDDDDERRRRPNIIFEGRVVR